MADTPNFGSILDKPTAEIERPKPLPAGHYLFVIPSLYKMDKSTKKGTEYVEFTCKPVQAGEDVDEDALKEYGDISEASQRLTYYLTENSIFRLKEFLIDDLGLEDEGKLRPMLDKTVNAQFIGQVVHEASQDGRSVFANIKSTAKAEG